MAVRSDAVADALSQTSLSYSDDDFTLDFWYYIAVDRNTTGCIAVTANAAATDFKELLVTTDGTTLRLTSTDFAAVNGTNLTAGTWYHIAIVGGGTSTYIYLNGVLDITANDVTAATTYTQLALLNDGATWTNARIFNARLWNAKKTVEQIQQEMNTIMPRDFTGLLGWWPMFPGTTERARDYSGNGKNFTESGTLTDEDNPPVSWGGIYWTLPFVSGGTVYTLDAAGSITPSSVLVRQANKALGGSSTGLGALIRQANKALSGSSTGSGALARQANKAFGGSSTGSGVVTRQANKALSGSSTLSGALVRSANKAISGSLTSSGAITRQVNTAYAGQVLPSGEIDSQVQTYLIGSIIPSGALTLARIITLALTGSITAAGNLLKLVNKAYAGQTTGAGELDFLVSTFFVGSLTVSGSLARSANKALDGAITAAGNLVKNVNTSYAGQLLPDGDVNNQANTLLSGSITSSGDLNLVRSLISLSVEGTITMTGNLVRQVNKALVGNLNGAGTVFKTAITSYSGSADVSGAIDNLVQTLLAGIIVPEGVVSFLKVITLLISGSITLSGNLVRQANKALAGVLIMSSVMSKLVSTSYSGVLSPTGEIIKQAQTKLAGVITFAGSLLNMVIPFVPGNVTVYFKGMFKGISRRLR